MLVEYRNGYPTKKCIEYLLEQCDIDVAKVVFCADYTTKRAGILWKAHSIDDQLKDEVADFMVDVYMIRNDKVQMRVSPFLMPVGTQFEHQSGTYEVVQILTRHGGIQVMCECVQEDTSLFNMVNNMRTNIN
jgi:hypothetical protein